MPPATKAPNAPPARKHPVAGTAARTSGATTRRWRDGRSPLFDSAQPPPSVRWLHKEDACWDASILIAGVPAAPDRGCTPSNAFWSDSQPYGSLGLDVAGGSGNEAEVGPRWGPARIDCGATRFDRPMPTKASRGASNTGSIVWTRRARMTRSHSGSNRFHPPA